MKIDPYRFGENLRRMRLESGLTQKSLGECIGFSEKSVSKWECGAALPDIETFFSIAEILKINAEVLLQNEAHYFLGIDGGGTKTDLVLSDESGTVLRTCRANACNPVDVGMETAKAVLRDAIYEVCRGVRMSSVSVFAGIAGGTTVGIKEDLRAFFAEFGFAHFESDSDNRNIVAAGLGDSDGMTVILGTGFCIYTQKGGVQKRISGWGYLLDDGGSGYNLGRDALHAYYAAHDGTGEATLLTEEIDRIRAGGPAKLLPYVYKEGKSAIASFAPAVFAACERGDALACAILDRNIGVAAELIRRAANMIGDESVRVVLAGGLTKERRMMSGLRVALGDSARYRLEILQCDPVQGALILARKSGGERT